MLINIAVIAAGLGALVWSADRFVEGAAALARRVGMSPLLIGMTIVSVGTSAPEILVSIMAAITGSGSLAVGNAFGSNIANIGMVLGITLLISPIVVGRTTVTRDLPLLVVTVIICGFLLWDRELSYLDAWALTGGLLLFISRMINHARKPDNSDEAPEIHDMTLTRASLTFAMGLIVLIAASRALVWAAVNIASALGISELIIGLTIVAVGTSLPELAASAVSAFKGHADIAIGAVVGSNMFNLLVVLAVPGFFSDLPLSEGAVLRDLSMVLITTLTLAGFAWLTFNPRTHRARLGRRAGAVFLSLYVAYYGVLFLQPNWLG